MLGAPTKLSEIIKKGIHLTMTIKKIIEKAIEGLHLQMAVLLVKLKNGKTMLTLWETLWKTEKTVRKSVGKAKVLFSVLPAERKGYELVRSTIEGKEGSEATSLFGMQGSGPQGFLFKKVQQARMRQALYAVEALRRDIMEDERSYNPLTPTHKTFKEGHTVAAHNTPKGQVCMRAVYAYRVLPRGRSLPYQVLDNLTS